MPKMTGYGMTFLTAGAGAGAGAEEVAAAMIKQGEKEDEKECGEVWAPNKSFSETTR
jgi:hypothetical protein